MDWIKRNLYFLIGSLLALALMGCAGWYLYSKWQRNNEILGQLDEQYAKLKRLYEQNPHPGSGKVDNIKAAKDQQQELRAYIQKSLRYFQRCLPIPVPESGKLTSQEFSSALSRTLDQMQQEATKTSVVLPPKDSKGQTYSFSFAAQRESLAYAAGSLDPLSVQLGEIKAICTVLFQAKINALDNLRRERVSEDDLKGPQTDYLPDKSTTNELAVLSPYEISFRCFSPELAAVLAGFASSPYGLLVRTINVEMAPATAGSAEQPAAAPFPSAQPYSPPPPPPRLLEAPRTPEAALVDRYGMMIPRAAARPVPQQTYAPPPASTVNRGGLPLVLNEKQLKVTLMLNVVKLVSPK
jgi:hypothetical protein